MSNIETVRLKYFCTPLQVCFSPLLCGKETQAQAREPFPECWGNGQATLFCLEANDSWPEKTLQRYGWQRQAKVVITI